MANIRKHDAEGYRYNDNSQNLTLSLIKPRVTLVVLIFLPEKGEWPLVVVEIAECFALVEIKFKMGIRLTDE